VEQVGEQVVREFFRKGGVEVDGDGTRRVDIGDGLDFGGAECLDVADDIVDDFGGACGGGFVRQTGFENQLPFFCGRKNGCRCDHHGVWDEVGWRGGSAVVGGLPSGLPCLSIASIVSHGLSGDGLDDGFYDLTGVRVEMEGRSDEGGINGIIERYDP
jgi:hypothetical protein